MHIDGPREEPTSHQILDRLYVEVLQHGPPEESQDDEYVYVGMTGSFAYIAFFEDFGPVNMLGVYRFCKFLQSTLDECPTKKVVIWGENQKSFTNAAFLVGAHLIIDHGQSPHQVMMRFEPVSANLLSYCDVSPGHSKFVLHLQDCWEALARAIEIGWLDFSSGPSSFDPEEYDHYASPLNADLNVIIPDKFIAMAGPVSFGGGGEWRDTEWGCRQFAPHYALQILQDFDVQAVVRLNEPEYDETVLSRGGIAVVDLFFEDCSTPPPDVVLKFMTIAERLEGPIAVHCKAGLGRTGTLIALYLMKHHGFTARQAIAWLRIVRPGSVIGQQQDFLCSQDKHMPRAREVFTRSSSSASLPDMRAAAKAAAVAAKGADVGRVRDAVGEVCRAVDRLMGVPPLPLVSARRHSPGAGGGAGAAAAAAGGGAGATRMLHRQSSPSVLDLAGPPGRAWIGPAQPARPARAELGGGLVRPEEHREGAGGAVPPGGGGGDDSDDAAGGVGGPVAAAVAAADGSAGGGRPGRVRGFGRLGSLTESVSFHGLPSGDEVEFDHSEETRLRRSHSSSEISEISDGGGGAGDARGLSLHVTAAAARRKGELAHRAVAGRR